MPIWLRRYTSHTIREYYEKQAEAQKEAVEKAQGIEKAQPSTNTISPPAAVKKASYTTKASKKQ